MCSKIYSLIFLLGSIQIIFGQPNILRCNYGGSYYCNLTVSNSGSEFFIDIEGQHVDGKEDSDITEISATALSNSATIPAVICTKFSNIAKITYTSIGLENIDKSAFKNCRVIKQLFLTDNEISSIDELAFSKNIELQRLYLTHNRILTLPNNVFETLAALKQLDISYNHIETLANEWFANLGSLQVLNLNNNQIMELPSGVFTSLTSLANINLGNNQLEFLNSDSFGNLPSLIQMDVRNNRISAIDELFIDNTSLTNLIMDGNECANDALIDSSPQKETMKQELATCFDNFNNIVTTTTMDPSTTGDSTTEIEELTPMETTETLPTSTEESTSDCTTEDTSTTLEDETTTEEITPDAASGVMIGKIVIISILFMNIILN